MIRNRKNWIDIYRGSAMLLVILQHTGLAYAGRFIMGFHMPLFFVLSGYLHKLTNQKEKDNKTFLIHQVNRLLVPYVFYLVVYWLIVYCIIPCISGTFSSIGLLKKIAHDLLYLDKYWFIMSLFVVNIAFHYIHKVINASKYEITDKMIDIIVIVISIVIVCVTNGTNYPLLIGQNAMAFVFWGLGDLVSPIVDKYENYKAKAMLVTSAVGFVIMCIGVILNFKYCNGANFNMWCNEYGNIEYALIGAVGGILFWAGIVYFLKDIAIGKIIMKWIGINSLVIYPLHLWGRDIGQLVIDMLCCDGLHWIALFAIKFFCAITVMVIGVSMVNRYCPLLAGRRKII